MDNLDEFLTTFYNTCIHLDENEEVELNPVEDSDIEIFVNQIFEMYNLATKLSSCDDGLVARLYI